MSLIGFLVNYADPEQRKNMPSGLLVTHERNAVVIGLGESPLSNLLAGMFLVGLEYPTLDKLMNPLTKKIRPKDLESFRSIGAEYLKIGRLKLSEIQISPPLVGEIPVTADLRLAQSGAPFEIVKIRKN